MKELSLHPAREGLVQPDHSAKRMVALSRLVRQSFFSRMSFRQQGKRGLIARSPREYGSYFEKLTLRALLDKKRAFFGQGPIPTVCGCGRILPEKGSFFNDSYLVDPASSHMLVSKIKPCMSKYKQICTVKLRMAH